MGWQRIAGAKHTDCLTDRETGRNKVQNATVESRKPSVMPESNAQEMSIGHLAITDELVRVYEPRIHQSDVVGEEDMMRESKDPAQDGGGLTRRLCVTEHFLIRGDPNKPALRQGACRPTGLLVLVKPLSGEVVMRVGGPRKGYENVEVQESDHWRSSSNAAFTMSRVIGGESLDTEKTGNLPSSTCLCSASKPLRARSERTSPTLRFSEEAKRSAAS